MSAFIKDLHLKDLTPAVKADVLRFTSAKRAKIPHFGMTVKELVPKADPHNLATARKHVKKMSAKKCLEDVQGRIGKKFILVNNDRIVDGHHFLAKAERGGVTNSLDVLDLTPVRFQMSRRVAASIHLGTREEERRRNPAVDVAAIAAGTGAGYAGLRIGKAAKAAEGAAREGQTAAKNARVLTSGILKTGRTLKKQLTTFPTLRKLRGYLFSEELTGKLAKDRFIKRIHDEDLDRRDANIARAGIAGALAGTLLPGKKFRIGKRALIGAASGIGGVLAVRQATKSTEDMYGERSRGAKKAEKLPTLAAIGVGGYGLLRKRLRLMAAYGRLIEFDKKKRELPAAVKAGASAAISGAGLGLFPVLRRGAGLKKILKSVATGAGAGAAVGGGGTAIGNKILGNPKRGEGAPITKRAAIGGGITGAAAGIVGGILAHRTSRGRRWLVKASKSWRPVRWARKSGPLGAAAIGGVAGAVAGTAHAADEGQQVDTIDAFRKRKPTVLFHRVQTTIEFGREDQPRYAGTKRYADPLRAYGDAERLVDAAGNPTRLTQSQLIGAAWRTGHRIRRAAQRGSNLTRDVADVASGRGRTRGGKPEWEKSWFRNTVLTGAGAGSVLAHAVLRRKIPAYRIKTDAIEKSAKAGLGKLRKKLDNALDLSARLQATIYFAYSHYNDPAGWDVRDGRGRSARVFAPGSRKRIRRPAEWHETKEGQRRILTGAGVAGAVATFGAGLALGPRLRLNRLLRKRSLRAPAPSNVIPISQTQAG